MFQAIESPGILESIAVTMITAEQAVAPGWRINRQSDDGAT